MTESITTYVLDYEYVKKKKLLINYFFNEKKLNKRTSHSVLSQIYLIM